MSNPEERNLSFFINRLQEDNLLNEKIVQRKEKTKKRVLEERERREKRIQDLRDKEKRDITERKKGRARSYINHINKNFLLLRRALEDLDSEEVPIILDMISKMKGIEKNL
jgi:hypothetical protein